MNAMQFSVEINANKAIVWDILWQDGTFREWAGIIDPGTHIVGELHEGNEVQFISASGYGVTSLVAEMQPNSYMLFKHQADTKDEGKAAREKEWTGGEESYNLEENEDKTTLTVSFGVPQEQEEYFAENYPKALAKIKELAENQ